ncbi:MAG TPA: DUF1919 domain-containing protein [Chitinophagaceae bacterium]|jgi:uncharacterized protein (DUF1919 family)
MSFKFFFEKLLLPVKGKLYRSTLREKWYRFQSRRRLKNKSFTIISNNCWAWSVYEDLGVPYDTPTVGLFFYAPCYIKFLKNVRHYLGAPLTFKDHSCYSLANEKRQRKKYPIGVLDDIEIHFLHYKNEGEAFEKWNRRAKRINFDNLFVACSEVDLCTIEHIKEFDKLNFQHKVFFSAKNYQGIHSLVWLKCFEDKPYIGDISTHRWSYRKYFDVVGWLNKQ